MAYILAFGSLRSGIKQGFNFGRFGCQQPVKLITLSGYEMYALTHYPVVCVGDGNIVCELQKIDGSAFEMIRQMEIGAGYYEDIVMLPEQNLTASIFLWPKERIIKRQLKRVESGDWAKYNLGDLFE